MVVHATLEQAFVRSIRRPHRNDDFDEALALVQAYDRAIYGGS